MFKASNKLRAIIVIFSFFVLLSLSPPLYAETQEQTITISEDQEWGQIIVESNSEAFEVDIITPDGVKWGHSEEQNEDVLFYFKAENFRHWAAEQLKSGTYKVIIKGPADAYYNVKNQNSYSKIELTLQSPAVGKALSITSAQSTLEASWSYTGDILRTNELSFWLQPVEGGERFLIRTSHISALNTQLSIPNNVVDGQYQLLIGYG